MREGMKTGANINAAKAVGKLVAERATQKALKLLYSTVAIATTAGWALADARARAASSFERMTTGVSPEQKKNAGT